MINIGIDVGKFKHCAAVIDDKTGEVIIKPFFFNNDQEGFELFYSKVKQYIRRKHSVGMEDTGHYMISLTTFLLEKKFSVKYINPRSTSLRRKELGMSAKNDRKDALLIAEMLTEKKFWKEKLYQTTMYLARKMLKEDIISEGEYQQINALFLKKYRPVLGGLFANI